MTDNIPNQFLHLFLNILIENSLKLLFQICHGLSLKSSSR